MRSKKWLYEVICFILMLNFFYEGIYKIAYLNNYGFWITYKPMLNHIGWFLKYFVPIGEIMASIMIMIPRTREAALYGIIVGEVIMILWLMNILLFTGWLIFPFQTLWNNANWMEKMLFALLLSWMAFIALLYYTKKKDNSKSLLYNKPDKC